MLFLFFLGFPFFALAEPTGVDSIINLGYGVNFIKVGEILSDGAALHHVWRVSWPTIPANVTIPMLSCENSTWQQRCGDILRYLVVVKKTIMKQYDDLQRRLNRLKDLFYPARKQPPPLQPQPMSSQRPPTKTTNRRFPDFPTHNFEGLTTDSTPHFFNTDERERNDDDDEYDTVMNNLMKIATMGGQLMSAIGNTPSMGDVEVLRNNIQEVTDGSRANTLAIERLRGLTLQVSQNTMDNIRKLEGYHSDLDTAVDRMQTNLLIFRAAVARDVVRDKRLMQEMYDIDQLFVTEIDRIVAELLNTVELVRLEVLDFEEGVLALTRGQLSPLLIPDQSLVAALRYLRENVLGSAPYDDFHFVTDDPTDYYRMRATSYVRVNDDLIIMLRIPIHRIQSRMAVYRVDTYPVPDTAGLSPPPRTREEEAMSERALTLVQNVPDFLALTIGGGATDTYIEMDKKVYMSCRGEGIKRCGPGLSLPRDSKRSSSCALAIFNADDDSVKKNCHFAYAQHLGLRGSAQQVTKHGDYIVASSSKSVDHWNMYCSVTRSRISVPPCNLCRMQIPCGCSMMTRDFLLPTRATGCEVDHRKPNVTNRVITAVEQRYALNTRLMIEMHPDSKLVFRNEYEKLVDGYYDSNDLAVTKFHLSPPIKNQTFLTAYAEKSKKYNRDLQNTLDAYKAGLRLFEDKLDAGLAQALDFTQEVSGRNFNIRATIANFFGGIFGNSVVEILAFVWTTGFLLLVAFVIATFHFVGAILDICSTWRLRRKRVQIHKVEDEDDDYYAADTKTLLPW